MNRDNGLLKEGDRKKLWRVRGPMSSIHWDPELR